MRMHAAFSSGDCLDLANLRAVALLQRSEKRSWSENEWLRPSVPCEVNVTRHEEVNDSSPGQAD